MPVIYNGSQDDRIKRLQKRTIYAAYLIEKQAVNENVIVKSSLSGLKSSELTNVKEAPLFFNADELEAIVENNRTIQANIVYAIIITLLAGSGIAGFQNGTAATARFNSPGGAVVDPSGNMYVADTANNVIRMIDSSGNVTTFSGTGIAGLIDGPNISAQFTGPIGIARDSSGNLYVADSGNNAIRKISDGQVTTIAGSSQGTAGFSDGPNALFNNPMGIAVDAQGNIYVADTGNNRIRRIDIDPITGLSTVTSIAGGPTAGSTDGTDSTALFNAPQGIAIDSSGNLYIADTGNNTIRTINILTGEVTTLAGSAGTSGFLDGTGTTATFNGPTGIAIDSDGNLYVTDTGNHEIRKITNPGAAVTTVAGNPTNSTPADGSPTTAAFSSPVGITIDASGNVYIIDSGSNLINMIVTYVSGTSLPVTAPSSPTGVFVTSADGSVCIHWNFPAETGGLAIIGYEITYIPID